VTDATFAIQVARELSRSLIEDSAARNSVKVLSSGRTDNVMYLDSARGEACTIIVLAGRIEEAS
jgi:hypothetical protein